MLGHIRTGFQKSAEDLAAPGSFEELVDRVGVDALLKEVRAKRGCARGLEDCWQLILLIELRATGDALFNGPWGYRAQYWRSPGQGLAANALLIETLAPKLIASARLLGMLDEQESPDLKRIDIKDSLNAASAKIWIDEKSNAEILRKQERDLAIERWTLAADSNPGSLANLGLCAPRTSMFEVKGALMSPDGHEVVPKEKIARSIDIHRFGFT